MAEDLAEALGEAEAEDSTAAPASSLSPCCLLEVEVGAEDLFLKSGGADGDPVTAFPPTGCCCCCSTWRVSITLLPPLPLPLPLPLLPLLLVLLLVNIRVQLNVNARCWQHKA